MPDIWVICAVKWQLTGLLRYQSPGDPSSHAYLIRRLIRSDELSWHFQSLELLVLLYCTVMATCHFRSRAGGGSLENSKVGSGSGHHGGSDEAFLFYLPGFSLVTEYCKFLRLAR
jgi:hypothetical protein